MKHKDLQHFKTIEREKMWLSLMLKMKIAKNINMGKRALYRKKDIAHDFIQIRHSKKDYNTN